MKTMGRKMGGWPDPRQLRRELQEGDSRDLRLRRAVIGLSVAGMASMAMVSLFQTGVIQHLPDPPLGRFDSDKVNSSETAYHWGVPDGTVSMASHAANVVLAAIGGEERIRRQPWVPLMAAISAAAQAVVAAKYLFHEMPVKQKRWCGYCIVDALAHLGTFALTLPAAIKAVSALSRP